MPEMSFNPLKTSLKTMSNETSEKQRTSQFNPWDPHFLPIIQNRILMETSNFPGFYVREVSCVAEQAPKDAHDKSLKVNIRRSHEG